MTEGGVVCLLRADTNPDKLHTVGIPWAGSEVFTIDEQLNRLPAGEIGELVGRSTTMMSGYQNQPKKPKRPAGTTTTASAGSAWAILAASMRRAS
jgi:acyl-CoA synthetase (AMP-forming)/AMP-acid ligase II